MTGEFSPGLILILGALLVPVLRGSLRSAYMLALPLAGLWLLAGLPYGSFGEINVLGMTLTTLRVDKLSYVFGIIFLIAAFLGTLYAIHVRDTVQHVAGLVYAGSTVGAVFAGDLVTLFVYWEGTAIASVFLIWASRTERAFGAGMRYLVIQIGSGVLLLAGIALHYRQTGSIAFGALDVHTLSGALIFVAFGVKCAFPLLHNWLQDSYPEATVTGAVMLSAFTTKLAVYALARGYAGTDILIPIGVVMAAFPIFYALIENDLRRVLAYSLNTQLGFMVVAVGVGTEMAINGAVAHAFGHILYKALLFMAVGAVLFRTGTAKASELGGLYKSMPWTAGFCAVGGASISAVPLFSGFVSKAIILAAVMEQGHFWAWIILLFVGAAAFIYSGIKVSYFAFFGRDSGKRCEEAPANMLVAMGITAALSIGIGVYPQALYDLLPYPGAFHAYSLEHVVTQLQLLAFSALAFIVFVRKGLYPAQIPGINLDTDWIWRRAVYAAAMGAARASDRFWRMLSSDGVQVSRSLLAGVRRYHAGSGPLARTWPTGVMAFWTTVMLAAYLVLAYLR